MAKEPMNLARQASVARQSFSGRNGDLDEQYLAARFGIIQQKVSVGAQTLRNSFCVIQTIDAQEYLAITKTLFEFRYLFPGVRAFRQQVVELVRRYSDRERIEPHDTLGDLDVVHCAGETQ